VAAAARYKRKRRHTSLGYLSPLAFEKTILTRKKLPDGLNRRSKSSPIFNWGASSTSIKYRFQRVWGMEDSPGRWKKILPSKFLQQKVAIQIYYFFVICKKHNVNPYNWLKNTLTNISTINHKNITDLYPQNFNNIQQLTMM